MKRCPKCKKSKKEKSFYVRKNGYLSSYCMECTREDSRKRYYEHKKNLKRRTNNV